MTRIVFATDLHLTEGRGGLDAFAEDLAEIAALAPDLLVQGGDVCLWEDGAGGHLQRLLEGFPCPVVHVMGNHDTSRQRPVADFDRDFVDTLGPRNTHTDLGAAHVLTLNTCRMQPEYSDWRNVRAELGDDDLAWLDDTLIGLSRDRPLLVFVHIPLRTTYPERRGADRVTADVWRVTNADAVHARLAAWPAPVVVGQGHLHENEHLHDGAVHYVSGGSVCGSWWKPGPDSRSVDGSPRGWMVADVDGGRVRLDYRGARRPADDRGRLVEADGATWLDLDFADPAEVVEVEVAGGWIALPVPGPRPVDDTFSTTHRWALPAGISPDGLRVRTTMRGRPWPGPEPFEVGRA